MHMSDPIPVRWVSRNATNDRLVTGWHVPDSTGRTWTIDVAGPTPEVDAVLARVADSPDLKRVIREQSEGIAVTAVAALRSRSARADGLAEKAVRRLFGRGEAAGSR